MSDVIDLTEFLPIEEGAEELLIILLPEGDEEIQLQFKEGLDIEEETEGIAPIEGVYSAFAVLDLCLN